MINAFLKQLQYFYQFIGNYLIYDRGYEPDKLVLHVGIIKPIFKNKGDPTQPEN